MPNAMPNRELSKSKLAMYLRTKCDRELYLSLFSNRKEDLVAAGIPVPLKSRPGVQLITASGQDFEYEQYDLLVLKLPSFVVHKNNGRATLELEEALRELQAPALLLQPQIEPESFRKLAFGNLGIPPGTQAHIPRLSGLRPDVLLVQEPGTAEYEIVPDGSRRRVEEGDKRLPISVIDLKNIAEANASYSAEVCLYAFFLANWLAAQGSPLADRYFISDQIYLWKHVEMPKFTEVLSTTAGGCEGTRLTALLEDLRDGLVNYLVFMPSVRKFFVEDVPRVVEKGDSEGWDAVEYHVNPRCGACDWLGNKAWLSGDDKKAFEAHPEHYCSQNAEECDHLSKLPVLSRGAARVLAKNGRQKVADLVGMAPTEATLRQHTILKKDRKQLGARAKALVDDETSVDTASKIGALARGWSAEYDFIVNFDAGSGFLTGIALRAVLSAPYGEAFDDTTDPPRTLQFLGEKAFVVPKDNPAAEWSALLAFIEQLSAWVDRAEAVFEERGWGRVRTQVCFWEPRQYEELCNAFGRHLLDVLGLPGRSQRALAWVFPAERLMEREDEICPNIVFIRDVVTSSVRLPQRFATTLLGTADYYHHARLEPRKVDSYYQEPLGNGIPRERIFEIWKTPTGTVRLFGKVISITEAIDRYGLVLKAQARALGSITARLRTDLKGALDGRAPAFPLSIPQGMQAVAHDSKLWNQWSEVSAATVRTEAHLGLISRAEWLEASYKAIVLDELEEYHGGHAYTFRVSGDSTEAKIEEGDSFCTVGIASWPGFPLQTPKTLNLALDAQTPGYYVPMHKLIAVTVQEFDRTNCRARIELRPRSKAFEDAFDALIEEGIIPIGQEPIYVLEGLPYDDSHVTRTILKAIGNPKCAQTAREALEAMGKPAAKKIPAGTDADTPIARILWAAGKLSSTEVRSDSDADALADFARTANRHPLNDSQYKAVRACAAAQLSIVWGPPGTGKTDTLVAFLHATVHEHKRRKILISGPNYRTVEELAGRLAENLGEDTAAAGDFFWVYSPSREPGILPGVGSHLNLQAIKLASPDAHKRPSFDAQLLLDSIGNPGRVTIVATTAHIAERLAELVSGDDDSVLKEIFDLVVLDESSQIPVTLALRPLAGLRADAQVVIAGDHLQMPPIQALEPPLGAEYLVSSIQTYLLERFGVPRQELLVNYRSNQDLVDYAKTLGYPAKLEAYDRKKDMQQFRPIEGALARLPPHLPTTDAYSSLLDPAKRVATLIHEDLVSSQANELEAGLVAGLAFCIRHSMAKELDTGEGGPKTEFDDDTFFDIGIGIVTPHKAQKALVFRALVKAFPDADPAKVYGAVDTVERFQGGERQTIIVSFGVGDTDVIEGEEAFLLQLERTNVAVSRAMAKCIVLMPKSLAYHLPSDQKAADTSIAIKSYVEEFCANRKKTVISYQGEDRAAELRWR